MIKIKKRFDINKLSLNENLTKCTVFGGGRINCEIKLNLNGIDIKKEYIKTKFLGVIMDHKRF